MGLLPKLQETATSRQTINTFLGYNHNREIRDGEWWDMENLTGERYPLLSTREARREVAALTSPQGIITKDAMAWVDGTKLVYNNYEIDMELSTAEAMCPKQLISMGAYLLIWPDKKWLNTQKLSEYGSMEHKVESSGEVTVTLCKKDGTEYGGYTVGGEAPVGPENGELWMDTSSDTPALKEFSSDSGMWTTIPTTYLKITSAGIGVGFEQYDGVTVSGFTDEREGLNGSYVIYASDTNSLVVVGVLENTSITETGTVTVARSVPDMDFVTECDNRIWGCKYGVVDGKPVNEIYASKLGDFKNWNCYMGLSSDSYAASRGSDGIFTGAITYQGHPLFFKENCIEKVYPSSSGAHQIVTTECRGVQKGCWRSLKIVGETVYYKSRSDICAYTGSLPRSVSAALGEEAYADARAGALGDKYYISMQASDGTWHLFVYDTARGLWHREDGTKAMCFTVCDGVLHWIDENSKKLIASGTGEAEDIAWYAESGEIGFAYPGNKYLSRFLFRAELEKDASVEMFVSYDGGPWTPKGSERRQGLRSFVLPVAPRRCDNMKIKLAGKGGMTLYSVSKIFEKGSDVMW